MGSSFSSLENLSESFNFQSLSSAGNSFDYNNLKLPSLPEPPYITFNSVMAVISSSLLAYNLSYCFQNYKDLPKSLPLKLFASQKRVWTIPKPLLFLLPIGGIWALGSAVLMAANTHLIPYPMKLSPENKKRADDLCGNFIYYGVSLSQLAIFQNIARLIQPDSVGKFWFKGIYGVLSAGGMVGYALYGWYFYKIIMDQRVLNEQ